MLVYVAEQISGRREEGGSGWEYSKKSGK